jgi:hypothetical protein
MSDDGTIGPAPGGNLVAAEYVLGVLTAQERREIARRLEQEPVLASEVAFWEERLVGLADAVAPVTPPPATWSRIEAAIGAPASGSSSVWQSLAFWRGFGLASATLAAASIAALAYIGLVPSARAPLMATLGGGSGQPNFVAAVTASGNGLVVVPAALLTNDPRGPSHRGRHPRGLAGAAWRVADRSAHRPGHRQRQAHGLVTRAARKRFQPLHPRPRRPVSPFASRCEA